MPTVEGTILAEFAICSECDSSYLLVEPTVSRHWRGWQVWCGDCDSLLAEIDPPEDPVDPRSL